jgi:division protein CdvB (Snf7/Vps24/ESCRT-III family)
MKLTYKPKKEKTEVYTIRLPISLIQRLKQLRVEADELAEDFSDSIADLMNHVADEYTVHLREKRSRTQNVHESHTEQPPKPYTNGGTAKPE